MRRKCILKSNILEQISKTKDIYQIKVGNMCVEIVYSENNIRFNECMLDILRQKSK